VDGTDECMCCNVRYHMNSHALMVRNVQLPVGRTRVELRGAGPPLLYLHGLTATPDVAALEAPRGYRLALPYQRGHGDLDWPTTEADYSLGAFVDDARAVLDELGWDRVDVGGTSMGAAVALRLALDHPDRVRRVFLGGPALSDRPNPDASILVDMAGFLAGDDMEACIEELVAWQRSRDVPVEMETAVRRFSAHRPAQLRAALRTVARWVVFESDELRRLPQAFVVGWPDDPLHPLDLAERIAAEAGAPLGLAPGLIDVVVDPSTVSRAWPLDKPSGLTR